MGNSSEELARSISMLQRTIAIEKKPIGFGFLMKSAVVIPFLAGLNSIFSDGQGDDAPIFFMIGLVFVYLYGDYLDDEQNLKEAQAALEELSEEQRAIVAGDYAYHEIQNAGYPLDYKPGMS